MDQSFQEKNHKAVASSWASSRCIHDPFSCHTCNDGELSGVFEVVDQHLARGVGRWLLRGCHIRGGGYLGLCAGLVRKLLVRWARHDALRDAVVCGWRGGRYGRRHERALF